MPYLNIKNLKFKLGKNCLVKQFKNKMVKCIGHVVLPVRVQACIGPLQIR